MARIKVDIGPALEAIVFRDPARSAAFVRDLVTPQLAADARPITFLHRVTRRGGPHAINAKLGLEWLVAFPNVHLETQMELFEMALDGDPAPLDPIVEQRLATAGEVDAERFWLSCAFVRDLPAFRARVAAAAANDPDFLWAMRRGCRFRTRRQPLNEAQLGFVVLTLGPRWKRVEAGDEGWGESSGYNASDFIGSCISDLADRSTLDAAATLDRLFAARIPTWEDRIAHARALQVRKRRDAEYAPLELDDVMAVMSAGSPQTIDDLRAYVLDQLEVFQAEVLRTETDEWATFWEKDAPLSEEICRDRLVALLRRQFPADVQLLPESLMPGRKRADIVALRGSLGVPVEIKGQWHSELWDAGSTQLDALYSDSWRAFGRGIYLVLWFGDVAGRALPKHPNGESPPKIPDELKVMLQGRLRSDQRDRIDGRHGTEGNERLAAFLQLGRHDHDSARDRDADLREQRRAARRRRGRRSAP